MSTKLGLPLTAVCAHCHRTKRLSLFSPSKIKKNGHNSWCKACTATKQRTYGFEAHRNYKLKSKYGITLAEYNEVWESQGGVCAICGQPETEIHQNGKCLHLAVDHNHVTNRVRGLLCRDCNLLIAHAQENHTTLLRAVEYLEKYK